MTYPAPTNDEIGRRIALARERDRLLAEVRKIDGFGDFLQQPDAKALRSAAEKGPVVIVNASRWRSDALIVRRDKITSCPLPLLKMDDAAAKAGIYLSVLAYAELHDVVNAETLHELRGDSTREAVRRRQERAQYLEQAYQLVDDFLLDLQAWMWETIASPVLADLGLVDTPAADYPEWPRLWWCPTGPLTLLPLHTAGVRGGGNDTVMDRVVSSYTPTLRSLLSSRRPRCRDSEQAADRLLLVEVPDIAGLAPIDNTAERSALMDGFPDQENSTILTASAATPEAVREALPYHRWVHFSAHGAQDLWRPSNGGLILTGGVLTIGAIAAGRFRGDFAGLSACKTALGGIYLHDEVITLASALHHSGFRHVVAALWSIDNETSAEVFSSLYRAIARDGRLDPDLAPSALHDVVRGLRDQHPDWPHQWTPFAHIGP